MMGTLHRPMLYSGLVENIKWEYQPIWFQKVKKNQPKVHDHVLMGLISHHYACNDANLFAGG